MTAVLLIACVGMIVGSFLLLGISPLEFTDGLFAFLTRKNKSIKSEINETTHRKKAGLLRREITETREILNLTGRSSRFSMVCAASLLLFAVGASLAILLGNVFLVPVLAIGMMFLPFWAVRLTATHYKKSVSAELETALSIITTAYLRNEDILTAVEESVQYLNPPVRNVFTEFLAQTKLIDPDVETALHAMKPKVQNEVFHEWIDAICTCQYDRSLKTTLSLAVQSGGAQHCVRSALLHSI